ncbi:MAG TPA: hypothetical protein VFT67_03015 [Jatrophihabitantaceae bacterium]|nr:hypothetical protein [Jatrophihabitantaceae bacterium]
MTSARPRPGARPAASPVDAALTPLALAGIVLLCAAGILAAGLELFLVPLRDGTTPVPVSVLFAAVSNIVLPRLGRSFADRTGAMVAPFLAWLVPMVLLALTARPEGDVIISGGGSDQWVYYLALLAGGIAGMVTVATSGARR